MLQELHHLKETNGKYCGVYYRIDTGDYVPVLAKTRQNTSVNCKLV